MIINDEAEAIEALEAVLKWAHDAAEIVALGAATGVTAQRGRIVATRVMPDETVGISIYETVEDAQAQTIRMERGYRLWEAQTREK